MDLTRYYDNLGNRSLREADERDANGDGGWLTPDRRLGLIRGATWVLGGNAAIDRAVTGWAERELRASKLGTETPEAEPPVTGDDRIDAFAEAVSRFFPEGEDILPDDPSDRSLVLTQWIEAWERMPPAVQAFARREPDRFAFWTWLIVRTMNLYSPPASLFSEFTPVQMTAAIKDALDALPNKNHDLSDYPFKANRKAAFEEMAADVRESGLYRVQPGPDPKSRVLRFDPRLVGFFVFAYQTNLAGGKLYPMG